MKITEERMGKQKKGNLQEKDAAKKQCILTFSFRKTQTIVKTHMAAFCCMRATRLF